MPETPYFEGIDIKSANGELLSSVDIADTEAREQLDELSDYVNYISTIIDYSTTEQNTGRKWIDGKPIYQITFSVNITFGSGNIKEVTSIPNTPIPNIDRLIDMTWIGDDIGGSRPANPALLDNPICKWYSKNDACFQVYIGSQYDCILKAITAWYTKTTDSAAE